jgi:uncharacterized protein (UPF0261 family)
VRGPSEVSRTPLALVGSIIVILSLGGAFMITAVVGVGCDNAEASAEAVCRSDSARRSLDVALAVVVGSAIALSAVAYVRRSWRLLWIAAVVGIGGIFLAAEVPNAF